MPARYLQTLEEIVVVLNGVFQREAFKIYSDATNSEEFHLTYRTLFLKQLDEVRVPVGFMGGEGILGQGLEEGMGFEGAGPDDYKTYALAPRPFRNLVPLPFEMVRYVEEQYTHGHFTKKERAAVRLAWDYHSAEAADFFELGLSRELHLEILDGVAQAWKDEIIQAIWRTPRSSGKGGSRAGGICGQTHVGRIPGNLP